MLSQLLPHRFERAVHLLLQRSGDLLLHLLHDRLNGLADLLLNDLVQIVAVFLAALPAVLTARTLRSLALARRGRRGLSGRGPLSDRFLLSGCHLLLLMLLATARATEAGRWADALSMTAWAAALLTAAGRTSGCACPL